MRFVRANSYLPRYFESNFTYSTIFNKTHSNSYSKMLRISRRGLKEVALVTGGTGGIGKAQVKRFIFLKKFT